MSHLPNFQKERLDRISVFRGGILGKRGLGGFSFYMKNKLKSEIFHNKKMGLGQRRKILILWGFIEKLLGGRGAGVTKKQHTEGEWPESRGGLASLQI